MAFSLITFSVGQNTQTDDVFGSVQTSLVRFSAQRSGLRDMLHGENPRKADSHSPSSAQRSGPRAMFHCKKPRKVGSQIISPVLCSEVWPQGYVS